MRREEPVVGGVKRRAAIRDVPRQREAWAHLGKGVGQIEVVVANAYIGGEIRCELNVVLRVDTCLPAQLGSEKRERFGIFGRCRQFASVKIHVLAEPDASEIHSYL